MSELLILTLPRESGADNAAERSPMPDPSGATVVEARYSTSGSSLGSLRKALRAACDMLPRSRGGNFSKAIKPLSEENGPEAFRRNWSSASGACNDFAWTGMLTPWERLKMGWS